MEIGVPPMASDNDRAPQEPRLPASQLFDGLSSDAVERIDTVARKRSFAPGSTIFEEGELADSLYIVASGSVRTYRVDRETSTRENVVTLSIVGAGGSFGEGSLINPSRTNSAEAVQRTECLQLMKDDVIRLMIDFPLFGLAVSQAAIRKVSASEDRVCNFGGGRWSSKRLASLLLQLAETEGVPVKGGWVQIPRPLTQSDLGSIIQASRETVSIQMKKLKDVGAVSVDGKIITVMLERIREAAS